MKLLFHQKVPALAVLWVAWITVSLAARDTPPKDSPINSAQPEPVAAEVSPASASLPDTSSSTPVDQSQSDEPAGSEIAPNSETGAAPSRKAINLEESPSDDSATESLPEEIEVELAPPRKTQWSSPQDLVRIFADGFVGPEEIANDFVVVGGKGQVEGLVEGDGVVILGSAIVNGRIAGDFVNLLGSTTLGPDAEIEGDLVVIGGQIVRTEGFQVHGDVVEISLLPHFANGHFRWVGEWFRSGLLMGRPLPHDQSWAWIAAGVLLLIALLLSLIFRRAIDSTTQVLDSKPAASLLIGMLIIVLSGPLSFVLTVSVVGLLVIPFYLAGLMVASVFGLIAVYRFAGQQMGLGSAPPLALLAGGIAFTLLYAVPVVGFLTWFLASILGTGAVFLALVKGLKGESQRMPPARVPMSPIAPIPPSTEESPPPSSGSGEDPTDTESAPRDTAIAATPNDPLMAERVGFWPRLGATALDFILIAGLISFIDLDWMLPFVWIAYFVVFWTWRQTTIGGIVFNLKVVRLDGQPLSFGVVAVRALSSIFSLLVFGLGFFWASWDEERQSWHDKIAGTTVIRVPKGTSLL